MQTARDIYLGCLFTDVQYTLQVQQVTATDMMVFHFHTA